MSKSISSKRIAKNVFISIVAQLMSLMTSFALGFIVPKFISEIDYSYWQVYVLYASYVGILHFGLFDGLVLRYSQYDYEELDKSRIRSQFQFIFCIISAVAFSCFAYAYIFLEAFSASILVLVAIGMVTKNIFTYTSYTFQITNRIEKYAVLVIIQRAISVLTVVLLLLFRITEYYWYCIADLLGDVSGLIVGLIVNRDLYIGKSLGFKEILKEAKANISAGIILMIANFASSFIIGGAKMVIQWKWDAIVFGKVAFSFSMTNIFLTFVTAISVVLFPSLKRTEKNKLPNLYLDIRNVVSPLFFVVLLTYFPISATLKVWLPKYAESLVYLGVLLPTIVFSSKVSLLTNNYLKAYREEKKMLVINVAMVAVSFVSFFVCAYLLDNLNLLLYFVVGAIMYRSVVSEIAVSKIINIVIKKDFVVELFMTLWFIVVVQKFEVLSGMLMYLVALIIYLITYRSSIKKLMESMLKKE